MIQGTILHFSIYEALPEEELLITSWEKQDVMASIYNRFDEYGILPMCKGCKHDCIQYNAPNLTMFWCREKGWLGQNGGNNGMQRESRNS